MDQRKQQSRGSSSSSSFTENLFGPKDPSAAAASSSGLFNSVFGPSSTGLGKDSTHYKNTGSTKNQEFGGPYGSGKHSTPDYKTQRYIGEKEGNPIYHNETAEPSYLSSSIYYGGQEVYSPNSQSSRPHHTFKKDGGDEDPNGNSASRGNWWQGSLYY